VANISGVTGLRSLAIGAEVGVADVCFGMRRLLYGEVTIGYVGRRMARQGASRSMRQSPAGARV
ncbi:MAG: hypothetical protein KGO05_13970, partial [Chloroflexota bacterium]|nr:hypothetical protein [Chloroflexota bacterium]